MTLHRRTLIALATLVVIAIVLALLSLQNAPAAAADPTPRAVAETTAADTVEPAASAEPTSSASPTAEATATGPRRVLVVGDSITQSAQDHITAAIKAQDAEIHILAWGGTAPCDWIEPVTTEVADFDPDLVLIEFAGNDLTPCIADTPRGSAGFINRYQADATTITHAARAGGATVRWTSVPYVDHADHEAVAVALNNIYRELSDDGVLTPLRAALTVDGGFGYQDRCRAAAECGDAPTFSPVPIRSDDGLHLTNAGSARMAAVYGQAVLASA